MNRAVSVFIGCLLSLLTMLKSPAQVIQLPSVQTFSYSGSVLVPDGGATSLGSVNRASQFSGRSGFLGGPSRRASSASRTGMSASVTIIDLDEMDRQMRGVSRTRRTSPIDRPFARTNRLVGKKAAKARNLDVSKKVTGVSKKTEAAKESVRLARRFLKMGERDLAKIAYQTAIADLDGSLQEFAIREYREIFLPSLR